MAKRFTDTEKWKRPWFRNLPPIYREFWIYILDTCDQAGIWYADFEMASFILKQPIDPAQAKALFSKQIVEFDSGARWFIKDFIEFQYGKLNSAVRFHANILELLKKHRVLDTLSPRVRHTLSPRVPDTPKDKDKDKDKGVVSVVSKVFFQKPSIEEIRSYCLERGKGINPEQWLAYYESNGWKVGRNPMRDWKACIRNWESHQNGNKSNVGAAMPIPGKYAHLGERCIK